MNRFLNKIRSTHKSRTKIYKKPYAKEIQDVYDINCNSDLN